MSESDTSTADYDEPGLYEVRIRRRLTDRWANWFEGMTISQAENGDTLLTGPVVDQAALYGLLRTVRDLGMTLISVMRVESDQVDTPAVKSSTAASDTEKR